MVRLRKYCRMMAVQPYAHNPNDVRHNEHLPNREPACQMDEYVFGVEPQTTKTRLREIQKATVPMRMICGFTLLEIIR